MTADELVIEIATLVAEGEYRDELFGYPGEALEGGGTFVIPNGESVPRRVYWRGTPEHHNAKVNGLVDRLPPLVPASPETLREAELLVGSELPAVLRRLYLEVANGGFGPGYGLLGLAGGHHDDRKFTAPDIYRAREFPEGLFPLCTWGCAIYSLIDLRDSRVWGFDPNPVENLADAVHPERVTLVEWFDRWLEGRLQQPWSVQDPQTGLWRGATAKEYEQALVDM